MASVVIGVDIGFQSSFVSVARSGGIETLSNEYSDRCTLSCVSFNDKCRHFGVTAKQQLITHYRNTLTGFTKFIGKRYTDSTVQLELPYLAYKLVNLDDELIGIEVHYLNSTRILSPEQVTAMQLVKLREVAEANLNTPVTDVVLNVPAHFTDTERRAMLDVCRIAGVNCLRIITDTTAAGLLCCLNQKPSETTSQSDPIFAIVDMGHSSLQAAVIACSQGRLRVLGTAADPNLGGRDMDRALFDHLAREFHRRYGCDVRDSVRTSLKLMQECERLRKLMSAISTEIPINLECFMNDKDFTAAVKRATFEDLIAPLLSRLSTTLASLLADCQLQPGDLTAVEIIGGSTRVPAVKLAIQHALGGQEIRTTLNADEAVARGCALQAAMLSPNFRVRELQVLDACPYGITVEVRPAAAIVPYTRGQKKKGPDPHDQAAACNVTVEVFAPRHPYPALRDVSLSTVTRDQLPLAVQVRYTQPDAVPNNNKTLGVARIDIGNASSVHKLSNSAYVRLTVQLDANGVFAIPQATLVTRNCQEAQSGAKKDGRSAQGKRKDIASQQPVGECEASQDDQVNEVVLGDLEVAWSATRRILDKRINEWLEAELGMQKADSDERARIDARNSLEEFVYAMRERPGLDVLLSPAERHTLSKQLKETEQWLYGEGETASSKEYVHRLQALQLLGDLCRSRECEEKERQTAVDEFNGIYQRIMENIAGKHYSPRGLERARKTAESSKQWLEKGLHAQQARNAFDEPVLTATRIREHMQPLQKCLDDLQGSQPCNSARSQNLGNSSQQPMDWE